MQILRKIITIEIHLKLVFVLDSYSGFILVNFFSIMEKINQHSQYWLQHHGAFSFLRCSRYPSHYWLQGNSKSRTNLLKDEISSILHTRNCWQKCSISLLGLCWKWDKEIPFLECKSLLFNPVPYLDSVVSSDSTFYPLQCKQRIECSSGRCYLCCSEQHFNCWLDFAL